MIYKSLLLSLLFFTVCCADKYKIQTGKSESCGIHYIYNGISANGDLDIIVTNEGGCLAQGKHKCSLFTENGNTDPLLACGGLNYFLKWNK